MILFYIQTEHTTLNCSPLTFLAVEDGSFKNVKKL